MTQGLGVSTAPGEDLGSIAGTHKKAHNHL